MQQRLWDENGGPSVRSVDELTHELKRALEPQFQDVSVEGEVFNAARRSTSGHLYFSLRGRDAVLPCALFRKQLQRLYKPPRDGDRIVCTGRIEIFPPHGRYQLVVEHVRLSGEGELLARLEALKRKLYAEGLFDHGKKRPLPKLPRRIGVVTSHTGAAIRDIVTSVQGRFPIPIVVAAAAVQGPNAAHQLTVALEALATIRDVDVIVVGRGGGSLQDLWAFNDEGLARAIAACATPVVSAVGHEVDTVISDLVADVRAPTPTAVGPLVVPDREQLRSRMTELIERGARALSARVQTRWQRLDDLSGRLERAGRQRVPDLRRRLEALTRRLEVVHPLARLGRERQSLDAARQRLIRAEQRALERQRARLERLTARLLGLSPTRVLERGYAIARTSDGAVIRSHADVAEGANIEVLLGDGALDATVNGTRGT